MRKIAVLVKKEIRDILRDKKTLVVMVAVPILLYPLIIIGMSMGFSMFMSAQEDSEHTVGYNAGYEAEIGQIEALYQENLEEIDWNMRFVPEEAAETDGEEKERAQQEGQKEQESQKEKNGQVEQEVQKEQEGQKEKNGQMEQEEQKEQSLNDVQMKLERDSSGALHVTLDYSSTEDGSDSTRRAVEAVLELYREKLVTENMERAGLDRSILYPLSYESSDSATFSESFGMDIGGSIGMMLMVTILLGAVYPSIDATAGEKERGTLETLLTLPVTNFQMILSKFISVSVFASVTAILSLLSLGGSVLFLIFGISDTMGGMFGDFSVMSVLPFVPLLLLTLIATALLATALCMCFCVFAKSFKEANNYVTPVLLIVMFASMTAMLPSIQLDYRTALIPIVNVSLMIKQMISGQLSLALIAVTMLVNFACSILIAWVLAKMYDSEAILFSDGFRSFRLFQKRSDIRKGTVPDLGDVVVTITVLLLLILYAGSAATVHTDALTGTAVNQLLILAVPLLVVWYMKSDVKSLFLLRKPLRGSVPGSVLLYLGSYCLIIVLAAILTGLFPQSTSNLQETFVPIVEAPLPLMLLVIAVMPAVGEEILFRGFLMGCLREKLGRTLPAVLISGLVFGAFHMSLVKLLPTFLLGVLFAGIVCRTGSIYVSMGLHFINNTISMLAMKYPEEMERIVPMLVKERLSLQEMAGLALAGAVLAALGWGLLKRKERQG